MAHSNGILRVVALLAFLAISAATLGATTIYASNFVDNTITAYDAATGAWLGTPVVAGEEGMGFAGLRIATDGSLFVAGQLSNNLLHYSRTGLLLGVLDPQNAAQLDSPQDIVFGPDGNLYVASAGNNRIVKMNPITGEFLGVFADLSGLGQVGPIGLAFGPDGNLYVTTLNDGGVVKLDRTTGSILGHTRAPAGIGLSAAVFGPDGDMYMSGIDLVTSQGRVYKYNPSTSLIEYLNLSATGGLQSPGGVAMGPNGTLIVANVVIGPDIRDAGSALLLFDRTGGGAMGSLVQPGNGLGAPFFLASAAIPEPSTGILLIMGLTVLRLAAKLRGRGTGRFT